MTIAEIVRIEGRQLVKLPEGFQLEGDVSPFDGRVSLLSCNRSSPRHGRSGSLIAFASTIRPSRVQPKGEFRRLRFSGDRWGSGDTTPNSGPDIVRQGDSNASISAAAENRAQIAIIPAKS